MNVEPRPVHFDNHSLLVLLITETVILGVVYGIGQIRGWASERFRFQVSWKWTAVGVLVYGASATVAVLVHAYGRAHGIHPETHASMSTGGGLTLPFIILNSVTNPLFEELLEAGYVVSALHKLGMWPAVLAGALFRAFLHAYLGASGAMVVLATGVIFGLVYWRWRQLWPLIVAMRCWTSLG
jgi:hypothetical protein